jgi:putative acetyltransferase
MRVFRRETGILNHEAVALYSRNGYEHRGPFEAYQPDPLSIFMEKSLMVQKSSSACRFSPISGCLLR